MTIEPDGIDIDELRKLLESGVRPKLAHIIPNYQNPAGVTLSLEKRRALLALAAEYGFTIFEDDPYADIRFRGEALPSMLSLDDAGVVVHASSFTKTVCPGVRVGYLVGPGAADRRDRQEGHQPLHLARHGRAGDRATSSASPATSTGRSRRSAPRSASGPGCWPTSLREHIPGVQFTEPDGGYFLWVELPDGRRRRQARCRPPPSAGVAVVKGSDFLLEGGKHALRLAYSAVTVDRSTRVSAGWPRRSRRSAADS